MYIFTYLYGILVIFIEQSLTYIHRNQLDKALVEMQMCIHIYILMIPSHVPLTARG